MPVQIIVKDPGHLEAHKAEYLVELDKLFEYARQELMQRIPDPGAWDNFVVRCPRFIGFSGLKYIWPWTMGAFWAPRKGRTIPSHLIRGKGRRTRNLCVWGFWQDKETFVLHTLYPGKPAPREIHDPSLKPEEMQKSVKFWLYHAILTEQS